MTIATLLLRASNPGGFILWCLIGICGGIYLFVQGFRLLQRRRLILDTPASKIRSASIGMVELNGLAVGPYTMVAPITERPCYCYRTFVWEWKQSGKNKQWVKVAAECMHVPFFLDDNTGKVMVDPRGADLDLHRDFQQEFCDGFFTTKEEAPPNVRSFLSRHGIMTTNKIKVEESCIKPKNALFLLGTLDDNPGLELTPDPIHDAETTPLIVGNALSFSINTEMFRNALSPVTGGDNGFSGLSLGRTPARPGVRSDLRQSNIHNSGNPPVTRCEHSQNRRPCRRCRSTSEGRHHQPGSLGRSPSNSHRRRDIHRHRRLRPTPRRSADERQEQPNLPHLLAQPARPRQLAGMEMHSDDLGRPRPSSAQPLPPASHNPHALRDFLSFRAQRGTISNPCHSKRSEESAFSGHLLHANHNHPRLNPAQPRSRQNREPAPIGPAPSL